MARPVPTFLRGRRVLLRAIERTDLEFLADLHNHDAVKEFIEFGWPVSLATQEKFFERNLTDDGSKRLVIEAEGRPIGYTGLWGINWPCRRATNGVIVHPKAQGHGFARDALLTLGRFAFEEVGLHRLDAEIYEFNAASISLYTESCGWVIEGRRREHVFRHGRFFDSVLVGQTEADYRAHVEATGYWSKAAPRNARRAR